MSSSFLNPLGCDFSLFSRCNPVFYYIVGMIALLCIMFVLFANKVSRGTLLMSTICHILIFVACSIVLLNLCVSGRVAFFSYVVIAVALLCTFMVVLMFSK